MAAWRHTKLWASVWSNGTRWRSGTSHGDRSRLQRRNVRELRRISPARAWRDRARERGTGQLPRHGMGQVEAARRQVRPVHEGRAPAVVGRRTWRRDQEGTRTGRAAARPLRLHGGRMKRENNISGTSRAVKPIRTQSAEIPRQGVSEDCGRDISRPSQTPRRARISRVPARATPRGGSSYRPDPLPVPTGRDSAKFCPTHTEA